MVRVVKADVLPPVSYPSYDPKSICCGISHKEWKEIINDLNHPFTNKIVSGLYPPGSTIKMGMALSFSKSGKGALDRAEYCKGYIKTW